MGIRELLTAEVERLDYRCLACGHEFEAPEGGRTQCPGCLGYRVARQ